MIKKTKLDNGLTIVTEKRDFNNIVSGIFIGTGLINETAENNGISHLVEHMLFKGTKTKTAFEMSNEIERVGGECNAYTADTQTVYYVDILKEYWKTGLNFLLDVVQNSIFPEEELIKEKDVVIQEILMSYDSVQHTLWKDLNKTIYIGQPLERTILGSIENINKFTREDLLQYVNDWYTPDNIVISVAGNIKHEEVVEFIKENWFKDTKKVKETNKVKYINNSATYEEEFEQAHLIVSFETVALPNRYDHLLQSVYSTLLDGGMSTRLFQELREKHGLVYSTNVVVDSFKDFGFFGIYAGVDEKNINKTVEIIKDLLIETKNGFTEEELYKAKNLLLFKLAASNDKASSRMFSLGGSALNNLPLVSYNQIKKEIEKITLNDIIGFTNKYITGKFNTMIIKPKKKDLN